MEISTFIWHWPILYIDPSNRGYSSRIDYILGTKAILKQCKTSSTITAPTPDHKAIFIQISINYKKRGKGYWKLNSSIIEDREYQAEIQILIQETIDVYEPCVSKQKLWDFPKLRIKEFSIKYSVAKHVINIDAIKLLEDKIDNIDNKLVQGKIRDDHIHAEWMALKKELDQYYF